MAKLYAELISDKMGRKATKTGDEIVNTYLYNGNKNTHVIKYEGDILTVFTMDTATNRVKKSEIIKS